jgi:hypothetical protein
MHPKLMTSPLAVVPEIVAVVTLDAVWFILSAVVVMSFAKQAQPVGAVMPVAPAIVIITVQTPVVPDAKVPAVEPPTVVEFEQPDAVNFVPDEISAGAFRFPVIVGLALVTKVVPVPVCDAIDVALPDDVMTPVRFAFVVTVDAATAVLQPNPVPLVHFNALPDVLHDGTACAVGATAVNEPSTLFAVIAVVNVPAVVAEVAVEAAIAALQENPVPDVQSSALPDVLHDGTV